MSTKNTSKKSWKTSLAGWAILVAAISAAIAAIFDGDPSTKVNTSSIIEALSYLGIGLPAWMGFLKSQDEG